LCVTIFNPRRKVSRVSRLEKHLNTAFAFALDGLLAPSPYES